MRDLKLLDPCCGSGHFLVAAFVHAGSHAHGAGGASLYAPPSTRCCGENLHGLELDPRCVELAAFALALAAWTYPGAGGYRPLPELRLACSGLAPNATKEQWIELGTAGRGGRRDAGRPQPIRGR